MLAPRKHGAKLRKTHITLIGGQLPILRTTLLREGFFRCGANQIGISAEKSQGNSVLQMRLSDAGMLAPRKRGAQLSNTCILS